MMWHIQSPNIKPPYQLSTGKLLLINCPNTRLSRLLASPWGLTLPSSASVAHLPENKGPALSSILKLSSVALTVRFSILCTTWNMTKPKRRQLSFSWPTPFLLNNASLRETFSHANLRQDLSRTSHTFSQQHTEFISFLAFCVLRVLGHQKNFSDSPISNKVFDFQPTCFCFFRED